MVHITRWVIAGTSTGFLLLNIAHAQSVPYEVVVRMYNTAGWPRQDVAAAQRVAERIYAGAGIRVQWRECRTPGGAAAEASDLCTDLLQARELIARLVLGGADTMPPVFGYALVDSAAKAGTIATLYADRVSAAAARLGVDRATLLGRTLAHELGHLLLGTNAHAPRGLMRARWADAVVRNDVTHDWQFSRREARHMQMALTLRGGRLASTAPPPIDPS
jgi:hypothetical protein